MAQTSTAAMTGKPLIESDRVEGTSVYDPKGTSIGSIKRLMIEKVSGRVAYAVMSFGSASAVCPPQKKPPRRRVSANTMVAD
jgi:hypothetical protein